MKSLKEGLGMIIETEVHGKVRVIDFEEKAGWGNDVIIYLGSYHMDNAVGRFANSGNLPGGALLVEKINE